jgi:RNA polymerase sigma-70 factor, ECF subfamily
MFTAPRLVPPRGDKMTTQVMRDGGQCRTWGGDFGQFYSAAFGLVVAVALAMVRRRELAEEMAQEAIRRTWRRRDRLKSPRHARNSVCRIVRNLCHDHLTSAAYRKERPLDGEYADARRCGGSPLATLLSAEERELVRQALGALPGPDRALLRMRYLDELTPAEIAERLGVTVWTANTRVHRARARLRELLAPYFPEYEEDGPADCGTGREK